MAEVTALKTKMPEEEAAAKAAEAELQTALSGIPNLPFDEVPVGPDETANVELRKVGTPRAFAFEPRQHFELGEQLGLMDFETAAKLSGARFVVLKGALARLERALGCFMLDVQTGEHGYTEVNPPILVSDEAMFGTAQLPKFRDDQFRPHYRDPDLSDQFLETLKQQYRAHLQLPLSQSARVWAAASQGFKIASNIEAAQPRLQIAVLAHPHRRGAADQSGARVHP